MAASDMWVAPAPATRQGPRAGIRRRVIDGRHADLIADDHEVVRAGVRGMLAAEPDWEVCAEAEDGRRALALAVVLKPDLAVFDVAMPGLNGIDVTRRLRRLLPKTGVLVLTMHQDGLMVEDALNAGALGYVLKSDPVDVLVTAVQHVLAGQLCLTAACAEPTVDADRTEREPVERSDDPARAGSPAAFDRGPRQQGDRIRTRHQPQDRGNASRAADDEARTSFAGQPCPVRGPAPNHRPLNRSI